MHTSIEELRAEMTTRFATAGIVQRFGQRWHLVTVYWGTVDHTMHDTLADAIAAYRQEVGRADEARWEVEMDRHAEQAAERYWEEGPTSFQLMRQAENDFEAERLGWDPIAVGAFGPDYN